MTLKGLTRSQPQYYVINSDAYNRALEESMAFGAPKIVAPVCSRAMFGECTSS